MSSTNEPVEEMTATSIRLPKSMVARLDELAGRDREGRSGVVRAVVAAYFAQLDTAEITRRVAGGPVSRPTPKTVAELEALPARAVLAYFAAGGDLTDVIRQSEVVTGGRNVQIVYAARVPAQWSAVLEREAAARGVTPPAFVRELVVAALRRLADDALAKEVS